MIYLMLDILMWLALAAALGFLLGWFLVGRHWNRRLIALESTWANKLTAFDQRIQTFDHRSVEVDSRTRSLVEKSSKQGKVLQRLEDEAKALAEQRRNREQRLSAAEEKVAGQAKRLATMDGWDGRLGELESARKKGDEDLAEQAGRIDILKKTAKTLEEKTARDLQSNATRLGELAETLGAQEQHLGRCDESLAQSESRLNELLQSLEGLESRVDRLSSDQQSKVGALETRLGEVSADGAKRAGALDSRITEMHAGSAKSNEALDARVTEVDQATTRSAGELAALGKGVDELTQGLGALSRGVDLLGESVQEKIRNATDRTEQLADRVGAYDSKVDELQKRVDEKVGNASDRTRQLEDSIGAYDGRLNELQKRVDSKVDQTVDRTKQLESWVAAYDGRADELQKQVDDRVGAAVDRTVQMEAWLSAYDGKIDEMNSLVAKLGSELRERLEQLEQQKTRLAPPAPAAPAAAAGPAPTATPAAGEQTRLDLELPDSETEAAPEPIPEPAPEPALTPEAEPITPIDDLKKIKGVGVVLERTLNRLGYVRFRDIVEMTPDDIRRVSDELKFQGRMERDGWQQQAAELHRAKYGDGNDD